MLTHTGVAPGTAAGTGGRLGNALDAANDGIAAADRGHGSGDRGDDLAGNGAVVSLGRRAAGLAAGAGAALAAGAFGAAGLPFFLLLMLSKILPSSVMMRHRATSIAKTSVMLVSTTVPSLASRARRARLGMDDPPLNGSSPR